MTPEELIKKHRYEADKLCPYNNVWSDQMNNMRLLATETAAVLHDQQARVAELEKALFNVLSHFTPAHLDYVSGSTCGTDAQKLILTPNQNR